MRFIFVSPIVSFQALIYVPAGKYSMIKTARVMHKTLPIVSFIIPTLNAASVLPRCLAAIREQDYPKKRVEIIVADGGSTDNTVSIAKQFHAIVISNPEVLHEPGKSRAAKIAKGDILFYTDADNVLSHKHWITDMVRPYLTNASVTGFLPQTIPAPDTNAIDRYLGYLFTDPFTWFVYGNASNPMTYERIAKPVKKTNRYVLFHFSVSDLPLFGLSQGAGTVNTFRRGSMEHADDMLAGIKLITEGGLIAYVPGAGVYHYHVEGLINFIRKYSWRVTNNWRQKIQNMGLTQRLPLLPFKRKIRILLFPFYSVSVVFPLIDAVGLSIFHKNAIMLLHVPMSFIMSLVIIYNSLKALLVKEIPIGRYE